MAKEALAIVKPETLIGWHLELSQSDQNWTAWKELVLPHSGCSREICRLFWRRSFLPHLSGLLGAQLTGRRRSGCRCTMGRDEHRIMDSIV
jgi:hypothetical protein